MSRRPAHFTQADVARAIRALRQTGAPFVAVELKPDGTVMVTAATEPTKTPDGAVAEKQEVVL
jgi:hypothetical protein